LGIAPKAIGKVFGVFKAYCTRVGSGPFPTELDNEMGEAIRKAGNEFGATTGRPRRTGWLDLPALRYANLINGVTDLIMMKSDVLSGFEKIKVCTHYNYHGKNIDYMPYDIVNETAEPVFDEVRGWKQNLTKITSESEFPEQLSRYITYIETKTAKPISIVSVGPDRNQTIIRKDIS
jgi:adenylosuccinate synthase